MAFQSYDQYVQNFGAALQGAGIQPPMQPDSQGAFGAPPNGAPPPQEGMVESGPPPQQQPAIPDPQAAGAFGPAPEGLAGAPPSGPFSPAPAAGPQPPPSGAFSEAPEQVGPTGLSMKKLFDDSSKKERSELADQMEQQVPDLIEAANNAAKQDPEGASKWDSFLSKRGWEREEAAAWLMEFGLRMMQAGGSGEGNFLSDVGGSAMGATEARRAFKTEEEEKGFKREDREWEAKKRERDEGKWEAEDREETRERKRKSADEMRRQEAHETGQQTAKKNLEKGVWTKTIAENGEVVFQDPNTKEEWRTGTTADKNERTGGRGPSVFEENWEMYRSAYAPEGWDSLTATEQSRVKKEFMSWMKTGAGQTDRSSHILQAARAMGDDTRWMRANGNPSLEERMRAAEENDRERNPHLYRSREGSGVVPDWSPEAN